jgi:uncharacterized protein (DUF1501 family)
MAFGCHEHTRSEAFRHAIAEAGNGLPSIEPGMPVPAGTGLSRRSFLLRSAGLAVAVYGARHLDALAVEEALAQSGDGRVLVSVFLEGGLDGLSVLAPVTDPTYRILRPNLGLSANAGTTPFAEDDRLHWHPAAAGLATLHAEGKLTVFPAIGYKGPNQSHFTSRHFWEVGALDTRLHTGWLGRYLDLHGDADNPLQGLSLSNVLMPALATGEVPVASVYAPHDFSLPIQGVSSGPIKSTLYNAWASLADAPADGAALEQAQTAVLRTAAVNQDLKGFTAGSSPVPYPNDPIAVKLAGLATMLEAGLPLRCVSIQGTEGYDTHARQLESFEDNFRAVSDSLLAFQRDLEVRGLDDRVLVQVWSEFGRRPAENGSGGTDHGAAGLAFVIGKAASGTMVNEYPGLAQLDQQGNLRSTSDFRGFYCALLEQWLGVDAGPIVPGADGFDRPQLLQA